MTKMCVSAIITAYNSEVFVAEAISSVLEQTYPVDEIVVVDDGSTDHTRDIVESFSQKGVRYIYQENRGPGAARNCGIRETSGELIAFLDADDVWLKNKIKMQLDFLSEHPDVALVSGFAWWWNVIEDDRFVSGEVPKSIASLRRDIMVHNKIGNPSRVMLRRSVLRDAGVFSENIRWGQDWDLWIRIITRYNAAILPKPLIVYRWHEKNLSHTSRWERLYSYWNVSRWAIQSNHPNWQRPLLMLRSWSLFTHRRAKYLIRQKGPRWQQIVYAVGAFFAYPIDMSWGKFNTMVRALVGDGFYQNSKRFIRLWLHAQG
jgi:glycosyltransferase involved in cell wall biosynthesis